MGDKHWWLYVLRLEHDKWYIGITSSTPQQRFKQHSSGFASARWTKKYKPLEIYDQKDLGIIAIEIAEQFENKVTREYIKQYGLANVRGGDITTPNKLVRWFNYYMESDDLQNILYIIVLSVIILLFGIAYQLKP